MIVDTPRLDRTRAIQWYRKNRARTQSLFDLLTEEAYYERPIALRHPVVFYEGHIPAFSLNTLIKKALRRPGIDERLERLFARGIDPDEVSDPTAAPPAWPDRTEVQAFAREADARILDALEHAPLEVAGHPLLDGSEALFTILEHEAMHQETLLYMWHRLPYEKKRAPAGYHPITDGPAVANDDIAVAGGTVRLSVERGSVPFGWDNEYGEASATVRPFTLSRTNITNAEFMAFVEDDGYRRAELWSPEDWDWVQSHDVTHPSFWEQADGQWQWRGMFARLPLPARWPVYVTLAEASAYARWRGRRLPTEAEYMQAVRTFPSGGHYDFAGWEPVPVGTTPGARTPEGVEDLVGNGWEWTSTIFAPFPGFVASPSYPEYSADFFDDAHYVMKGASPVTARELVRPSFRNWFRPRYPYVYATFRLAGEGA